MADVRIRPLAAHHEYRAAEQLQLTVWGGDPIEVVADNVLIPAHKYGAVVLGAFAQESDGERLIGFVFSAPGIGSDGTLLHHSYLAAVLPGFRDAQVGTRLKLAQREAVLAQGIDLITWTFDPLQSRNAALNLRRLGTICRAYARDFYGPMRDALNADMPSDRLFAEWHLRHPHTIARLNNAAPRPTLAALHQAGVPIVTLDRSDPLPTTAPRMLIAFPYDIDALKRSDPAGALRWRMHTRQLLEQAFVAGYAVIDVVVDPPLSYYLLDRSWRLHAA
jgi:predicted GNAT superfamily acetyltransferase